MQREGSRDGRAPRQEHADREESTGVITIFGLQVDDAAQEAHERGRGTVQQLDVEEEREASRFEMYLDEQPLIRKCSRIRGLEVKVLICGAISRYFQNILTASGITVIPWICGSAKEVVEAYMEGTPLHSRFLMPGCNRKKTKGAERENSFKGIAKG